MAFWVVLAKIVEIVLTIKKYAGILRGLRDGNLVQAIVASVISSRVMDAVNEVVPLDKISLKTLKDECDSYLKNEDPEFLAAINDINQPADMIYQKANEAYDTIMDALFEGDAVGNSPTSAPNIQQAGDPIEIGRGEFVHNVSDIVVRGAGIDFDFARCYRSNVNYVGPLGRNWTHSYNIRIRKESDFVYYLLLGDLSEQRFIRHPKYGTDGYNYFTPQNGNHNVLTLDGTKPVVNKPGGVTYRFVETARKTAFLVERIEDKLGNYLQFHYDSKDRLSKVDVNSAHRNIEFHYDDIGRFSFIRDHSGRTVRFDYNYWGYLEKITGPEKAGDDSIIRTERYEYERVGYLRKLTQVIDWKGRIITENEYESDTLSEHFGKIIRQCVNRGESHYLYESITSRASSSLPPHERPVLQVIENKRNGNRIIHVLNEFGNELERRERVLEGDRFRYVVSHYRYNADGNVTLKVDPDGVLTQYLYTRDHLADTIVMNAFEHAIEDISEDQRKSFGNLLAEVVRGQRVAASGAEVSGSFRAPSIKIPNPPGRWGGDIIKKYTYDGITQLIKTESDPRYTESADPDFGESGTYTRNLISYDYGSIGSYSLEKVSFPPRTRPDGTEVTDIFEEIAKRDSKGRTEESIDKRGYKWFSEYYDTADAREGFLKKKKIPHQDWILTSTTPELGEISWNGTWQADATSLKSSGTINEDITISLCGSRIELFQSTTLNDCQSQNSQVEVSIDNVFVDTWDQSQDASFLIDNLENKEHELYIRDTQGKPVSVGRILTHTEYNYDIDGLGQVIKDVNPRGFSTLFEYDQFGYLKKIEKNGEIRNTEKYLQHDPNGLLIFDKEIWFDEMGIDCSGKAVHGSFKYDRNGLLLSNSQSSEENNEKRISVNKFDAEDNLRFTINPRGSHIHYSVDALNRRFLTTRGACSIHKSSNRKGYSLAGKLLFTRNDLGALHYNGYCTSSGKWMSGIDEAGRIRVHSDPLKNLRVIDYDKEGREIIIRLYEHNGNGTYSLLTRGLKEYDEHGDLIRLTSCIFENPIDTGKPVEKPDEEYNQALANGLVKESTTEYYLDANGNQISISNPDGSVIHQRFDGQNRLVDRIEVGCIRQISHFDGNGNLICNIRYDSVRNPVDDSIVDFEVFVDNSEYDSLDRIKGKTDPYGNQWKYEYDSIGNMTKTIDPLGNITSYSYNAFGEETQRISPMTDNGLGSGNVSTTLVSKKSYDENGNLYTFIDPKERKIQYRYDALDRLIETWNDITPSEPHEFREYDSADNLVSVIMRNGLRKIFTYDLAKRHRYTEYDLSNIHPEDLPSSSASSFSKFDYNAAGKLVSHENAYCLIEIKRDSTGLPLHEKIEFKNFQENPGIIEISRNYNKRGFLTDLEYPNGRKLGFTFDSLGQVKTVKNKTPGINYLGNVNHGTNYELIKYHYVGNRLVKMDMGNGVEVENHYDGRGHLVHQNAGKSDGTELWWHQTLRDSAGFIRLEAGLNQGVWGRKFYLDSLAQIVKYEYIGANPIDPNQISPPRYVCLPSLSIGQSLIDSKIGNHEIPNQPLTFEYDKLGNRIKVREPGMPEHVMATNDLNQYTEVDGDIWRYSPNGEKISDATYEFEYDHEGALQSILLKQPHGASRLVVSYFRDALGRLIAEKTDSTHMFRVYDRNTPIVEYSKAHGDRDFNRKEFTLGAGNKVNHLAFDGEDYWLVYDDNLTLKLVTDHLERIICRPFYAPFGLPLDNELANTPINMGFGGMWFTEDLPFHHAKYRSYCPETGRYLQQDPAGYTDGINLYTYSKNNPIRYFDSSGLESEEKDFQLNVDVETSQMMADLIAYGAQPILEIGSLMLQKPPASVPQALLFMGSLSMEALSGMSLIDDDSLTLKFASGGVTAVSLLCTGASVVATGGALLPLIIWGLGWYSLGRLVEIDRITLHGYHKRHQPFRGKVESVYREIILERLYPDYRMPESVRDFIKSRYTRQNLRQIRLENKGYIDLGKTHMDRILGKIPKTTRLPILDTLSARYQWKMFQMEGGTPFGIPVPSTPLNIPPGKYPQVHSVIRFHTRSTENPLIVDSQGNIELGTWLKQ